ncbi:MAG: flagellar type III secretion system protein FlhB [Paracoccaceae bacterium]
MSDTGAERPHEPTPRKLDQARQRGEGPRLTEMTAAIAMLALLGTALLPGGWVPDRLATLGRGLLVAGAGGDVPVPSAVLGAVATAFAPVALVPPVLVIGWLIGARGLIFAPVKLLPKASRVSPLANATQKFGAAGLVEFAKTVAKALLFALALAALMRARLPAILALTGQEPVAIVTALLAFTLEFMALVVAILLGIGVLDTLWQRRLFRRQNRMSDKELRDELKESEGDPHLRQKRRNRAQEIAQTRMMADVPRAAVVIVNPTHYAVALAWSPSSPRAPVCVAKGTDEVAARIRDAAMRARVPIRSDPPTARALHASVRLGDEIKPEHFAAVAAAIRFADAMRHKARQR